MEPHTEAYGLTQTPPSSSYRQLPSGHLLRLRGSHRSRVLCLQKTGWAENSRALGSWCTIWERRHRLGVGGSSFWISSEFLAQWGRVARGQRGTLSYRALPSSPISFPSFINSHHSVIACLPNCEQAVSYSRQFQSCSQLYSQHQEWWWACESKPSDPLWGQSCWLVLAALLN